MNTYIVFDLEWNQSPEGKKNRVDAMPFEIIEIGAIKLDSNFNIIGKFKQLIRPKVYKKIHFKVYEVIQIGIEELQKKGISFKKAYQRFCDFAYKEGENPIFCTWGDMDLTEFQRNIKYHNMKNRFKSPLLYYDIQKLYSILYVDGKEKTTLDKAVEELKIKKDRNFHNALDDAYYTSQVMRKIDFDKVKDYISLDYYNIPHKKEDEIYLIFPNYSKYVSKRFKKNDKFLLESNCSDIVCYKCNRILKKRIAWFNKKSKIYYALAFCPVHKYVKSKIRVKNIGAKDMFIIKTTKIVSKEDAQKIVYLKEKTKNK